MRTETDKETDQAHQEFMAGPKPPPPGKSCFRIEYCLKENFKRPFRAEVCSGPLIEACSATKAILPGSTQNGLYNHRSKLITAVTVQLICYFHISKKWIFSCHCSYRDNIKPPQLKSLQKR